MARSDKRFMVYPAPRAIELLGGSSPALNQALECWAAELARASAQNCDRHTGFSESYFEQISADKCDIHEIHDWAVLAYSLKGKPFDPEFSRPQELLAAAVEDAHTLEKVGNKWVVSEIDLTSREVDAAIAQLAHKLRGLTFARAWAIIVAVQWYWEHHEDLDLIRVDWWTLSFRRSWSAKKSSGERNVGAKAPHATIRKRRQE
jgi:hypothetical protein